MIVDNTRRAISYLEQDGLLNRCMLEALGRNNAFLLYAESDGVLLLEKKSKTHMLSVSEPDTAERLMDCAENASQFLIHQKFCIPLLQNKFGFKDIYDCVQAVYTCKKHLPVSGQFEISVLGGEYEEAVLRQYHTANNAEYIHGIMERREMFGAFLNGSLAGFIGMHEEGSIGLLEVLPEYRRMGVGSALESYMINGQLEKGWTPFCQIFTDNTRSLALQQKLGLALSEEHVYWLF